MADPGDPFRIDPEKTVIRPMPARPSVARPVPRPAASAAVEDISLSELIPASANAILAAASPLLALAIRVRGSSTQPDIAALRDQMLQQLKLFQERLRAAGIAARTIQIAHRAVCALLDDIVLNTPWGAHSAWRSATLFSVFHGQVTGGDWFFDALKQLLSEPRGNADVLELMYSCLSLGFEGRLRMQANGAAELARVREVLYSAIRQERGEFERELSPHWQGIQAAHKSLPSRVPLWVYAAAAAAILAVVFVGFTLLLSAASNPVFAELARLPPERVPNITGGTALPNYASHADRLRQFLAPEISAHLVSVKENQRTIIVSLSGTSMFETGSANIADRYLDVLSRIGGAVQDEPGQVTVVGHTDSTPIHTIRFPSNYELSLARAEAARDLIRSRLSQPLRVSAEGMGDSAPLTPNTTPEGREQNRRIEIVLMKPLAG